MKSNDLLKETLKPSSSTSSVRRPSLKINAVSNWASLAINTAVGFLLTPFIIRELGKTGFGIWTLVGSFIGYYGLLNLGIGSAITRYIARYTAQKEDRSLNEVASTALVVFCVTGVLAVSVSLVLSGVIADFFNVEPQQRKAFIRLIWIIGITTGISFPGSVFEKIVTAREHFVAVNVVMIVSALLRTGLTVLFINLGWDLLGVGLASLAATAVAMISSFFLFEHYASDIHLQFAFVNKRTFKILLAYGGITTVIVVADIFRMNIGSFVIGKLIGLDAVGVYSVAILIIGYMTRLITACMGVLNPRFASLDGIGNKQELQRLFLRSLSVSSYLAFGASIMVIIFGPRFITLWAGKEYSGAAPVLIIIACAYAFALSQSPGIGLMYALNKHYYYAFYTMIEAVMNLGLSLILVFRYGIVGVALGTTVSMLIIKVFVMPVYVSKILHMSMLDYIKPILFLFFVALFIVLTAYHVDIVTKETLGVGYLVSIVAITGAIYAIAGYYMVVRKYNPTFIMSFVRGRRVVRG